MKNLELLELTAEELGGQEPGTELRVRGVRYHVVEVTPPVVEPPAKWRKKPASPAPPKWRLLVRKLG
jgi:hypothetical protein